MSESSVFTTQGAISWGELQTSDPKAACEFYGQLFGWSFEVMPMPDGDYHVVMNNDKKIAGIMQTPPEVGNMPPVWGSYVTVDDIDETAEKATKIGGKLLVPPMDIPAVGRFSLIQDPQGACISAIQYAEPES